MNKRNIGKSYEDMAADYLKSQGLKIVDRNFMCRIGEIDIIAIDFGKNNPYDNKNTYVFVEVKYRSNANRGNPYEAVDYRKRKKIIQVARYYCMIKGGLSSYNLRFDVISILNNKITWYKNAFYAE